MPQIKDKIRSVAGFLVGRYERTFHRQHKSLTVFCFHDVTDTPSEFVKDHNLAVSIATFSRQIEWVLANFNVIHPGNLGRNPLPDRAALLTFDDGFQGSFNNGVAVLAARKIPSVMFLNMRSIIEQQPLVSSVVAYLSKTSSGFTEFAEAQGLQCPYHLTMTPELLRAYERGFGSLDMPDIARYQGALADFDMIKQWDGSEYVTYGNHLFEHWNAAALTEKEFEIQYDRNRAALSTLSSYDTLFAFPNGKSGSCYLSWHLDVLKKSGARYVFSANGTVNKQPIEQVVDRVVLVNEDDSSSKLWFRVNRARWGSL